MLTTVVVRSGLASVTHDETRVKSSCFHNVNYYPELADLREIVSAMEESGSLLTAHPGHFFVEGPTRAIDVILAGGQASLHGTSEEDDDRNTTPAVTTPVEEIDLVPRSEENLSDGDLSVPSFEDPQDDVAEEEEEEEEENDGEDASSNGSESSYESFTGVGLTQEANIPNLFPFPFTPTPPRDAAPAARTLHRSNCARR